MLTLHQRVRSYILVGAVLAFADLKTILKREIALGYSNIGEPMMYQKAKNYLIVILLMFLGIQVGYVLLVVWSSHQGISETEEVSYYDVSAIDFDKLKNEISQSGPNGYAASTRWNIAWSWRCSVKIHTTFNYPNHTNLNLATEIQLGAWSKFMQKLKLHERAHQNHGRKAAIEIAESYCVGANSIVKYWSIMDKNFDFRTNHGATEGAVLRFW